MYAGEIKKMIETRREDGIPSASFCEFCRIVSELAVKALICEVDATPKPGLVDRDNNGAHRDMDRTMFLQSARALRPYFQRCAGIGAMSETEAQERTGSEVKADMRVMAEKLRSAGRAGEAAMYEATGGVNTHKGLVFSLGIVCAACGWMEAAARKSGSQPAETPKLELAASELQRTCAQIAKALLDDGSSSTCGAELTHGQLVRRRTGISGVKGEALSGFETAFAEGLPQLRKALAAGASMNGALVETLVHLLSQTDDSNLVYRGGVEGLTFVKDRAGEILRSGICLGSGEGMEAVRRLDRQCIEKNLSPGGCADLLAITVMLHFVTKTVEIQDRKEGDL